MNCRTTRRALWLICGVIGLSSSILLADGPADNQADRVRPVPPPGIEVSDDVQRELREGALKLQKRLEELAHPDPSPADIRKRGLCEVIPRAVLMTLDTNMFYSDREIDAARDLLKIGAERLKLLDTGASESQILGIAENAPLKLENPTPVAGGFRSRIDGSIQPYGLILPAGWQAHDQRPLRLDVWLHGRGEKVSEVAFLQQRMKQLGEYTPADTVVLHPYGRYCNAFKFAGEIDVLEAIEHVQQLLPIDDRKIVIRGFSMGGAGCWQLAVHYPNLWGAANPGAGFSETTEFLRVFQQEVIQPTTFQQQLLHWYDCPDWTNNLRQVPTVAYSGEKDRQKQAADVMAAAFASRGMQLPHVIGPNTEHKIHADSKLEIEQFLSDSLREPRPRVPHQIDLTTYMLRYHQLGWLSIEGLVEHWRESRVQGKWLEPAGQITLTTQGVTRLRVQFPDVAEAPTRPFQQISIDGQTLDLAGRWDMPQRPLHLSRATDGRWSVVPTTDDQVEAQLSKRPGRQGPIDDAFMDRFALVGPDKSNSGGPVAEWAASEFKRAGIEWKRHFRGDPPVVDYAGGEPVDRHQNLILFGRPSTNRLLAKMVEQLPIEWNDETLVVNGKRYSAHTHVPILIYPLPHSPEHYVVINSGFTYREYAYLNNARQVAMLPDWAVVDVSHGATTQMPGEIVDAGFFDEQWQFKQ